MVFYGVVGSNAREVGDSLRVRPDVLVTAMDAMRPLQVGYSATGATHAAGIFDAEGRIGAFAEDIGRHNALD